MNTALLFEKKCLSLTDLLMKELWLFIIIFLVKSIRCFCPIILLKNDHLKSAK